MKKLKPIKPEDMHIGCLTCSTVALVANMQTQIAVVFGDAYVTCNGQMVYDGEAELRMDISPKTIADVEKMVPQYEASDWRIIFRGPLHGETYQRQRITPELKCGPLDDNHISPDKKHAWVMVESNQGFA